MMLRIDLKQRENSENAFYISGKYDLKNNNIVLLKLDRYESRKHLEKTSYFGKDLGNDNKDIKEEF